MNVAANITLPIELDGNKFDREFLNESFLNKTESIYLYVSLGILSAMAVLFANMACSGRIYEPEVPMKLRK